MKSIKMNNGNIEFTTVSGIDEFWQRVTNSLKIYSNECFYNQNLGLDIQILHNQDIEDYKMEHITSKLQEWYKDEIESINYEIISVTDRILKARIRIIHKEYSNISKDVTVHE